MKKENTSGQIKLPNNETSNAENSGPVCTYCGRTQKLKRIDGKYILTEIGSVLNFEKGILYTIRELVLRPGKNIKQFIKEDRNRLVKPVIFVIVCSLLYNIAQQLLHFEDGYINFSGPADSTAAKIFEWVQQNSGNANLIMALFIGFWIKLLFRKYNYNYFEILILLCFIMGIGMLFYTVFGIIEGLFGIKVLIVGGVLSFVYVSWAIGLFFDKRKIINYFKALLSYVLGMISFSLSAVGLGFLIDMILK